MTLRLTDLTATEGIARITEALIAYERGECEDFMEDLVDRISATDVEQEIDLDDITPGSFYSLIFDPAFIGTTVKVFKLMDPMLYKHYVKFIQMGGLVNLFAIMGARLAQMEEQRGSNIIRDLMDMDDAEEPNKKDE